MHWIDWTIIALFLVAMILVGVYFSKKAGESVDSFFVSGRSLKWYVAGASMIATSFAADTPLWVGGAVRKFGIHAAWTYWAPLIGSALGVVLFARMWRRSRVVTDIEILEYRYSGDSAKTLRGLSACVGALLLCPLTIGWVSKAMVTISQEVLNLGTATALTFLGLEFSPEMICTLVVMSCALLLCAFSGLYGVVYTDLVQFILATAGAFILAYLSVKEVGGLSSLYEQLSTHETWQGRDFNLLPKVYTDVNNNPENGSMSIWNIIGFFGLIWWGVALSGGYQAQRILACKDDRHASQAMLLHTIVYYAVISLPWIIVALASIVVFPDLPDAEAESAYPKMIMTILPIGLKGMMVAAMIAAFISTMSTLFNWGSSYIVNDLYQRFIKPNKSGNHYVMVARIITVIIAICGGIISYHADDILSLLMIFWTAGTGLAATGVMRWMWWRTNAKGELAGFVATNLLVILMLFVNNGAGAPILDGMMGAVLGLSSEISFTENGELQGARMLLVACFAMLVTAIVSLMTKPTDMEQLKKFVMLTRIFPIGWKPVIKHIPGYQTAHPTGQTLFDWGLVVACVTSLIFAMNSIVLCNTLLTIGLFILFAVLLVIVLKRTKNDDPADEAS